MKTLNRVIIVVLDSVGVGYLPDAEQFGDVGANTLANIAKQSNGISLPNMENLGLGNIIDIKGVQPKQVHAAFGKAAEKSPGKDTTTGHWEIAGVQLDKPFPTYSSGFSKEVIDEFIKRTGRGVIGNTPASGTAIINELGEEQLKTGKWIVYTSADPVFQIAAHEKLIPLEELYKACEIALEICSEKSPVSRVIARPYLGTKNGDFNRTANRHDFSVEPPQETILDKLKSAHYDVIGIGKTKDIFAGRGITESLGTNKSNLDGIEKTIKALNDKNKGLIFTNLVDFDMQYGHRRDVEGYKNALEEFDAKLPEIIQAMNNDDLLIITADHGCDPTHKGTDHTREYIPIMAYHKHLNSHVDLGIRESFADISDTIEELFFNTKKPGSFLQQLLS